MGPASLAQDAFQPIPGQWTDVNAEVSDLYRLHAESVYLTALRITGNSADAEDVLQSVFVRIMDHGLQLDPMRKPVHYLRRAATNASIDLLRKRTAQAETVLNSNITPTTGRNNEASTVAKDTLRRALASLPPRDAELFVLCYLEGYSYDELAEHFEMERPTVGSRLHRIRGVLQEYLSE